MDDFDFSIGRSDILAITLLANGIAFNQLCIATLGEPEYISIGINREKKIIVIKPFDNANDKSFCRYAFVTSDKKKQYIKISASKLRAEIIRLIEVKPARKGIKFVANFDSDKRLLFIDLKQIIF